ncbi:MAG: hypothetical protein ACO3EO_07300 [Candidatus Kapaibacteriota bacterium]
MDINSLISTLKEQVPQSGSQGILTFDEDILTKLSIEDAKSILAHVGTTHLMQLPKKEVLFFEWLKENHPLVWNDLWGNDHEHLYVVGIEFFPLMLDPVRGFPICDLLTLENYFFVPDHLIGDEIPFYLEAVKERYLKQETVTVAQLLVLEISMAPIDAWRFSYHHRIEMDRVLKAIQDLKEEGMLLHLGKAEDLADFISFEY